MTRVALSFLVCAVVALGLVALVHLVGCGASPPAADAGPCACTFALCRSDGTCWCPTDAGVTERCEAP